MKSISFNGKEYSDPAWFKFFYICYFAKDIEKQCNVKIEFITAPDGNSYKLV